MLFNFILMSISNLCDTFQNEKGNCFHYNVDVIDQEFGVQKNLFTKGRSAGR